MGWQVSEGISAIGFGRAQLAVMSINTIATIADSFEIILLSFISPLVRCEWHCTAVEEALLTSGLFFGMCIGGFAFAVSSDTAFAGRRQSSIWALFLVFGAGFSSAFAPNIWSLIAFRTVLGFGIAGSCLSPYTCMIETLPETNRGALISVQQLAWAMGSLLIVGLAWLVLPLYGWRYLVLACSLPAGLCAVLAFFCMPESPHLLVMHGMRDEALAVLVSMAAMNGTKLPEGELIVVGRGAGGQLEDQTDDSSSDFHCVRSLGALFDADTWATTLKLWLVWFSCAFTFYGTILVTTEYAKETDDEDTCTDPNGEWSDADQAANVFSTQSYKDILSATWGEVAAFFLFLLLVEPVGRRWLMSGAFAGFAVSFGVLAAVAGKTQGEQATALAVALFFARMTAALSFTTIYAYTVEIYNTKQRAMGLSMGYMWARFGGMVTPFVGQVLFNVHVALAAFVYIAVALIAACTCASFSVETTGRKLKH